MPSARPRLTIIAPWARIVTTARRAVPEGSIVVTYMVPEGSVEIVTFGATLTGVWAVARASAMRAGPIVSSRTRRKISHHRPTTNRRSGTTAAGSRAKARGAHPGEIDKGES